MLEEGRADGAGGWVVFGVEESTPAGEEREGNGGIAGSAVEGEESAGSAGSALDEGCVMGGAVGGVVADVGGVATDVVWASWTAMRAVVAG